MKNIRLRRVIAVVRIWFIMTSPYSKLNPDFDWYVGAIAPNECNRQVLMESAGLSAIGELPLPQLLAVRRLRALPGNDPGGKPAVRRHYRR